MKHSDFRCPQVALFALKDIEPDEELCYDYGDIFWAFKGIKQFCQCQRYSHYPGSYEVSSKNEDSFGVKTWP